MDLDKIVFFGCSFTALEISTTDHEFTNHRKLIVQDLKLKSESFAKTAKSNQHIIDDIYRVSKNANSNTIFVIQFTFLNRLGMYCELRDDEFISMCKTENPEDDTDSKLINFYNQWLSYFYSRKNQIAEFEKQVDLICGYLNKMDIKYVCYGYDEDIDLFSKSFYKKNNFIKFDNTYSYWKYIVHNRLRIADEDGYGEHNPDYHLSNKGHRNIAEFIIKTIKENDN